MLDPLALRGVAPLADLVIAVVRDGGAPAGRATTTMAAGLAQWDGPPLIVIRPEVHDAHPIRGGDPARLIAAGYQAARSVLARWDGLGVSTGGVYPSL